jgi:hypothetical protein
MKRLLILASGFCLLLATAAPARINSYSGTVGGGGSGTVTFQANVVVKRGKCIRRDRRGRCIRRRHRRVATYIAPGMQFQHVPIHCDDGDHTLTITKTTAIPVNLRHFSSTGSGGTSTITITGVFARGAGSATGTIRDSGTISGITGCDTGTLSWSAT